MKKLTITLLICLFTVNLFSQNYVIQNYMSPVPQKTSKVTVNGTTIYCPHYFEFHDDSLSKTTIDASCMKKKHIVVGKLQTARSGHTLYYKYESETVIVEITFNPDGEPKFLYKIRDPLTNKISEILYH